MAPRKKSTSSSKKPNQSHNQPQPPKFGIQHFFERHTQNSQKLNNESSSQSLDPKIHSQGEIHLPVSPSTASAAITATHTSIARTAVVDDFSEVSPEVSKSVSVKRFKFSPGLLIKQSQDDMAEEVTWKISPVNERLQAVSKRLPDMVRVLADASKLNGSNFHRCSMGESSLNSVGKLEEWLSSPILKPADKPLDSSEKVFARPADKDKEIVVHGSRGSGNCPRNTSTCNQQSPFRTPPSISYCPGETTNRTMCKGATNQLDSQQHRKALLELLDQVEDVIAVEETVPNNSVAYLSKEQDTAAQAVTVKINSRVDTPQRVNGCLSDLHFLVLEVSEKHKTTDSSSAQCPYKVLRLLNEQTGEERALHLHDEWFYSVIGPGDTINVIGEFDYQGKCAVDHENNLIIVHLDILVSGTRVAASFGCPRRSVLDERLKCNDHSTAALAGTMLHQIFQVGLLREYPMKGYFEEYASIVLQKNIESMYACGGYRPRFFLLENVRTFFLSTKDRHSGYH